MDKYYFARVDSEDIVADLQIVPKHVCLDVNGLFSKELAELFCIENYGHGEWIQTYRDANANSQLRYNYAGIGYKYDREKDAFYTLEVNMEDGNGNYLDESFQWQSYPVMYLDDGDKPGYGFVWYPEFPDIEELIPEDPNPD